MTQGSSCLATLGLTAESRWDSSDQPTTGQRKIGATPAKRLSSFGDALICLGGHARLLSRTRSAAANEIARLQVQAWSARGVFVQILSELLGFSGFKAGDSLDQSLKEVYRNPRRVEPELTFAPT